MEWLIISKKKYDKAREDLNTVLEKDFYDPSIENKLKESDFSMDFNPHYSAMAYDGIGRIDYDQKNYQAALENFNKAINEKEDYEFFSKFSRNYGKTGGGKFIGAPGLL